MFRDSGIGNDFVQHLRIEFPNKEDGVLPLVSEEATPYSDFPYIRRAPLSGYRTYYEQFRIVEGNVLNSNESEVEFMVPRTRTKMADNKIVSAYYTKIFPEITLVRGLTEKPGFRFTYYSNTRENDRNLEFDVESNEYTPKGLETRRFAP